MRSSPSSRAVAARSELGIGTGRIAIPLAARGVEVHGIDASPAMLERLRAKPGGDKVTTTVGHMADVAVDGDFALVFIVFNTFFMLESQAEQVRCLRNVAARLAPDGRFLLHAFVPDTSRIERGQDLSVREAGLDRVRLDASTYNAVEQRLETTQVRITESGIRLVHAKLRFAFPPELDLMAELAGVDARVALGFVRARAVHRRQRLCGFDLPPGLNPAVDHDDPQPDDERAGERKRGEGAVRQFLGRRCRRRPHVPVLLHARPEHDQSRVGRLLEQAGHVARGERLQLIGCEQHHLRRLFGEALHHRVRGILPTIRVGSRGVLRERGVVRRVTPDPARARVLREHVGGVVGGIAAHDREVGRRAIRCRRHREANRAEHPRRPRG